jgi:RND family efflux transporter MFP subunit
MNTGKLASFCACLALIVCLGAAVRGDDPVVAVCKPSAREISEYEDFTGRAAASRKIEIRARVTGYIGYITKINFKEGAAVKQGDLLYELDQSPYRAELDQAKATLRQGEASLSLAKATLARNKALRAQQAIAEDEVSRSQAEVDVAQAKLAATKATLEIAELRMSFTKISSLIDGRIGASTLDAGNLVQADTVVLATIVSTDPAYVYFDVDETTFLRLRRQQNEGKNKDARTELMTVRIALADEKGFPQTAKLDFLDNQLDAATGTIRFRAVVPNPKQLVLPGMFVRVRFTTGQPYKAMMVPTSAVHNHELFVVDSNGILRKTKGCKFGKRVGAFIAVTEGLKEGDFVAIEPARCILLRENQKVKTELVEVSETSLKSEPY